MASSEFGNWGFGDPSSFSGTDPTGTFGQNAWEKSAGDFSGRRDSHPFAGTDSSDSSFQPPPWIAEQRERVRQFFQERMDPSYSMFSPQARDSAARQVGAGVATNERRMRDSFASRGINPLAPCGTKEILVCRISTRKCPCRMKDRGRPPHKRWITLRDTGTTPRCACTKPN